MNVKTFVLGAAAAALSVGAALATTGPASASTGPCAQGFCVQQVSETSPALALADGASHRVIGTSNLTTGASHYIWKPTSTACPNGWGNVYKTAEWDPAGDAGASGLYMTAVNGTQVYDHPSSVDPSTYRQWCYDPNSGGWFNRATSLEIKTQGNGLAITLVPAQFATALDARQVN